MVKNGNGYKRKITFLMLTYGCFALNLRKIFELTSTNGRSIPIITCFKNQC